MASATSFASAGRSLCLVQAVSYDGCSTSGGWPQICLRIDWKPNSNSLMAKSLRLKPKDEFANGFPRFRRLVVCCKSNSPVTPSRKFKVSDVELNGLHRQAKAMSSEGKWEKMVEIEYLMKINNGEFSESAWNAIAYSVQVAKKKQRENQIQIVETEHLMKAILKESIGAVRAAAVIEAAEANLDKAPELEGFEGLFEGWLKYNLDLSFSGFAAPFVFSKAKAGIKAFSPMLEAINKFIQCHPPPTPNKVVVGESSEPNVVLMQGPYLESLIERAIQYKNENGEEYVEIKYLILAFTQDDRFGKKFMKDFQIPFQTLTSLKTKNILPEHLQHLSEPEYETNVEEMDKEIEACLSSFKNEYDTVTFTHLIYLHLIKQKIQQQEGELDYKPS